MADVGLSDPVRRPPGGGSILSRLDRLPAQSGVQRWAARLPLLRRIVRRDGAALFDLVAGFCHSQVLLALVRLQVFDTLLARRRPLAALAHETGVPIERMAILLRAGAALGLLAERRGIWRLTRRGAALAGVPGLQDMIDHHDILYRDLADPVAFFRGETTPELARFWPYVFGAGAANDPDTAARYSALMADSQRLVAEDTLAVLRLSDVRHAMDVGGGSGAFLCALGAAVPAARLTLFDLPAVAPLARQRLAEAGLSARAQVVPGSFRDDRLPTGADLITLVRVLYDHDDATVLALLRACHAALPPGGRLVVSEPMAGSRAGDAYFALYCLAMQTGTARDSGRIAALLGQAGFAEIRAHAAPRPYVTSVLEAVRQT